MKRVLLEAVRTSRTAAVLGPVTSGSILCRAVGTSVQLLARSLNVKSSWLGARMSTLPEPTRDFALTTEVASKSRLVSGAELAMTKFGSAWEQNVLRHRSRDAFDELSATQVVQWTGITVLVAALVHAALTAKVLAGSPGGQLVSALVIVASAGAIWRPDIVAAAWRGTRLRIQMAATRSRRS
jgi:hypothetical protein